MVRKLKKEKEIEKEDALKKKEEEMRKMKIQSQRKC
jgi:hypothetical protein